MSPVILPILKPFASPRSRRGERPLPNLYLTGHWDRATSGDTWRPDGDFELRRMVFCWCRPIFRPVPGINRVSPDFSFSEITVLEAVPQYL